MLKEPTKGLLPSASVMFLPFAFYIGLVIKLRPRLLPFLAIGHFLIDITTLTVYFTL